MDPVYFTTTCPRCGEGIKYIRVEKPLPTTQNQPKQTG